MARPLDANSRKFLVTLAALSEQLGRPANAIQVANAARFDEFETSSSLEDLKLRRLIKYAADLYDEWVSPYLDREPLWITEAGREVLAGEG